jgi:DNA (cytosine-5)-methyltransferase 1
MTFGSLFSGIGGFDLGLERAGMEVKWQVEIDPYCQKVLAKHWPGVKRYNDVKEVGKHNLETVDLICGGFPCQPHSVAGKRRGAQDDRDLWPEYFRIVKELRPTWIFGENVPGIRTTILDNIYADLESENYTVRTFNIPACAFNAPHIRKRIFILAYSAQQYGAIDRCKTFKSGWSSEIITNPGIKSGGLQLQSRKESNEIIQNSEISTNPNRERLEKREGLTGNNGKEFETIIRNNWWTVEPELGRVVDGISSRVDRLRCLGNAVVPQIIEWFGKMICEANIQCHS